MLHAHEVMSRGKDASATEIQTEALATVTLSYDDRKRTRLRTRLDSGEELAILIPRQTILRDGDVLRTDSGTLIAVRASAEPLSEVCSDDIVALARACYHLGNRHVPVQIGRGWARYQRDEVLDEMLRGLGFAVAHVGLPFQPEPGAYGGGHGHHHH